MAQQSAADNTPVSESDLCCVNQQMNNIIVSRRQEGNPLLKYIRAVRWQYGDIMPDYQLGATACAIFLSLRYAANVRTPSHVPGVAVDAGGWLLSAWRVQEPIKGSLRSSTWW